VEHLIVPAGGARLPLSSQTACEIKDASGNIRSKNNLFMNGAEVFNFTVSEVPGLVQRTLERNNETIESIDYFVFHQANSYMLGHLQKKCLIPDKKFCQNMKNFGNTVSSTIPIAINESVKNGSIKGDNTICLIGFGVGYSWGGVTVELGKDFVCI